MQMLAVPPARWVTYDPDGEWHAGVRTAADGTVTACGRVIWRYRGPDRDFDQARIRYSCGHRMPADRVHPACRLA